MRAIARIDVIIADSLFTAVATTPDFSRAARDAKFCIARRRVNYHAFLPPPPFFSVYQGTAINKCRCSDCYRGRPRNEMWNENAGSEWRPRLGCARLRLRLKERARESIIFRESWPGERFPSLAVLPFSLSRKRVRREVLSTSLNQCRHSRLSRICLEINLRCSRGSFLSLCILHLLGMLWEIFLF